MPDAPFYIVLNASSGNSDTDRQQTRSRR